MYKFLQLCRKQNKNIYFSKQLHNKTNISTIPEAIKKNNHDSYICMYKGSRKKKRSSTNGQAIKRGGGKGRAIKEKRTFLKLFFIMLPFKNKNYFTVDNLSKYGHITLSLSAGIFTWLLQYFPKNRAILVQKMWGEKKLSKSVIGDFKTKKEKRKKKF